MRSYTFAPGDMAPKVLDGGLRRSRRELCLLASAGRASSADSTSLSTPQEDPQWERTRIREELAARRVNGRHRPGCGRSAGKQATDTGGVLPCAADSRGHSSWDRPTRVQPASVAKGGGQLPGARRLMRVEAIGDDRGATSRRRWKGRSRVNAQALKPRARTNASWRKYSMLQPDQGAAIIRAQFSVACLLE